MRNCAGPANRYTPFFYSESEEPPLKNAQPEPLLKAGDVRHGFAVTRVTPLRNLRAVAYELEHQATGAKVLHLHSGDAENLFSVAFRTPPPDDTGVPHILEHSVLGGSRKFPVKDPFVEMIKMSMATFINAMTYSDKTVYPVASNVRQDFYNLAEVYMDAVFDPLIKETTLKQEGHHLEFAEKNNPESPLVVKGIVFNEMKGAYSSADQLVGRESFRGLFPDTAYGKDSGGDPEHIPELTYPRFKGFYDTLYHPSNGYFFLYGDIPTVDHLAFLEPRLARFKKAEIDTKIGRQPRWKQPRIRKERFSIGKNESAKGKAYLTVNWLAGDGTDAEEVMAFHVLDYVLLGNAAAPLRKALIDSKLGEDLTHCGYSAGHLESTFDVGLKGSEPDRMDALLDLVLSTLRKIAADGIPKDKVEAAFHQLAYRYLEIQSMFPLWLMDRAYATWIYGADPLVFLRADEILEALRKKVAEQPGYLEKIIRERLIENPHRIAIAFVPDAKLQDEKDAKFAKRMAEKKAALTPDDKARIVKEAEELEAMQSAPNSPEALATLPQLKVSDLPLKPKHIPTTVEKLDGGWTFLRNDVFANGVNYLRFNVDLAGLPVELYPYLGLYGDFVGKLGAAGQDYLKIAERIAAHTGGVGFSAGAHTNYTDPNSCLLLGTFSLKALDGKIADALGVLHDLLFALDPRDEARLKDVLVQARAAHRSSLVESGLWLALRHASRGLNPICHIGEALGGIPQTHLVEDLAGHFAERKETLIAKTVAVRDFLLNRRRWTVSFTGSESVQATVKKTLSQWAAKMKDEPIAPVPTGFTAPAAPRREGLAVPAEVAFCAEMLPAHHVSHPDAQLLGVASRVLSLGYMWEEVRIKGGAYGGGCGFNGGDLTWNFYSYRDPNVKKTLDTFHGLLDYLRKTEWSKEDIDRAIIGSAKDGERPIRPGAATGGALMRHVLGDTKELREARHAAVLRATPKEVKRAALQLLEANLAKGSVCVVSGRDKLEAANKDMPGAELTIEDVMK